MSLPTGADVAAFLGRSGDSLFVIQADAAASAAYEFAKSYCRGRGFEDDENVPSDLRAVIVASAARLATNPNVLRAEQAESYASSSGPDGGWTAQELSVLHRYRRRTA